MPISNLTPFVTDLPDIQKSPIIPAVDGLRKMSIVEDQNAVLYDDGTSRVVAPVWTYAHTSPAQAKGASHSWIGPMLQTRSGRSMQVEWSNAIPAGATNPIYTAVDASPAAGGAAIPQNVLGSKNAQPCPAKPFFVTHLHGAATAPNYDGWPESMTMPGQSRRVRYDNIDRATLFWYHDHAMHTTSWNVYAGMAGPYLVGDLVEDGLTRDFNMPAGRDHIAMVLRDCNLTLDPATPLQAGDNPTQLLHKIETGVIECFGPINMVNGAIWPKRAVDPGVYRLRILNGANARAYALSFVTDDGAGNWTVEQVPVTQIGSDGGLMDQPRDMTGQPLVMMPAERVDLLVDFTAFAGQQVLLINRAAAPFGGQVLDLASAPADPDTQPDRNPYPQVMRFDVRAVANVGHPSTADMAAIVAALPTRAMQPNPAAAASARSRTIVLLEKDMGLEADGVTDKPPMLTTLELIEEGALRPYTIDPVAGTKPYQALMAGRAITINENGVDKTYRVCAERFQDPVNFEVIAGSTENWRFINLSPDSHPMHLHLVQFKQTDITQIASVSGNGQSEKDDGGIAARIVNDTFASDRPVSVAVGGPTGVPLETGLKDTIRVDPMTMVEIVATFEGYLGRYLYHCHLLEHEDHDMMRQFVVTRDDIAEVMPHHGMHPPGSIGK